MKRFFYRIKSFFISSYLYLKKTLFLFLFVLAAFAVLVFFSMQGEESHQRSCRTLGIECEKGLVHSLVDDTYEYGLRFIKSVKEKFKQEPKKELFQSDEKKKDSSKSKFFS